MVCLRVSVSAGCPGAAVLDTIWRMQSGDEVLFEHPTGIRVTNTQAQFGPSMYTVAGITSVTMDYVPVSRTGPVALALIGVTAGACGYSLGDGGAVWLVGGALLVVVGVLVAAMRRGKYSVRIVTAGGQSTAVETADKDLAARVSLALKTAISSRR